MGYESRVSKLLAQWLRKTFLLCFLKQADQSIFASLKMCLFRLQQRILKSAEGHEAKDEKTSQSDQQVKSMSLARTESAYTLHRHEHVTGSVDSFDQRLSASDWSFSFERKPWM